jgi:hypothetical protein
MSTKPLEFNPPRNESLIYYSISAVMSEISPIGKERSNTQGGFAYKFRGIDDIYNAIQPILAKHGVFMVPKVIDEKHTERTSKNGGTLFHVTLKIEYTLYARDGSFVTATTVGEAMDSGDKGCNKAMSAAQKYAFLQIFNIPTAEDKDTENQTHEVAPKIISDAQRKRLYAISKQFDWDDNSMTDLLREFGYEHSKEIRVEDYGAICDRVEGK